MKRRSATSSPPEPVFFTDENLGRRIFPHRLRAAGVQVEAHLDHFQQGTPDVEWLEVVAAERWVLLTLDARLRYNRLERDAIMEHGLAAFVLIGGRTHEQRAEVFLTAYRRVLRFLEKHPPPFIAKVYSGGKVTLWLNDKNWRR